jgi:LPS-assembly lipoprotein
MSLYRIASLTVLLVSLFSLGACGFEPIYTHQKQGLIRDQLAQVRVSPIADRIGQELRNNLFDILTPQGIPNNPLWDVAIVLSESEQKISLKQTSFATRINLNVNAQYHFKYLGNDKSYAFDGTAKSISSYNILDSDYANLIAKRNARSRAAKNLSIDIARQLALWMRSLNN